jgi:hypothetical protein
VAQCERPPTFRQRSTAHPWSFCVGAPAVFDVVPRSAQVLVDAPPEVPVALGTAPTPVVDVVVKSGYKVLVGFRPSVFGQVPSPYSRRRYAPLSM